jgi:tetratricopeptide (TPR) repeat protein
MNRRLLASLASLLLVAAPALAQHEHDMAGMAGTSPPPLFSDLGSWTREVTATAEAQKYFDQGLRLYYGFNHAEAIRAFREAARLDPACAMAWWGVAVSAGPNINMPMDEAGAKTALEAIARAKGLAAKVSAADQAYIATLAVRYSGDPMSTRAALDTAYCNAMRELSKRFPKDADAATLFAESILDLNPWNQWTHEGKPNPGTLEAITTLERVLRQNPEHPGANHFYIHAVEASDHPERALASAKRLETLVPGAGHLVHMPSHIYARTGQYAEALERNRVAVAVDEKYIAEQKPEGAYPLMYYNHNIQFIWFTAMMAGRSEEALAAARKMAGNLPADMIAQMPMLELGPPYPVMTLVRFGRWDEALSEPLPPVSERYASGIFHYARGVAFAAKGQFESATAELDSVRALAISVPADMMISINWARPLLRIATSALAGEIATRKGETDSGVRLLQLAVAAEDSLHYDEPPTWCYPVRHSLGAALLKAGRARDAETVYRDDLRRHPGNGWSLNGLAQALRAEGRSREAGEAEANFKRAWAQADVKLAASAY